MFHRDKDKIRIKFRIATDKQAQMFELLKYSISGWTGEKNYVDKCLYNHDTLW